MTASNAGGPKRPKRLGRGLAALKHWQAQQRQQPPAPPPPPVAAPPPSDQQLLRAALASVSPLKARHTQRRATLAAPPSDDTQERQRRLREHAAQSDDTVAPAWSDVYEAVGLVPGEDHQYLAPGQPADVLSRLRRGQWAVHASVDLHGCTTDDARSRLERFMASCLTHGMRCVRVIHGKGHGSDGQPVLRQAVRRWLSQMPAVQAFVECPASEGGTGALRVLLRH